MHAGMPPPCQGDPPAKETPLPRRPPCQRYPPAKETPLPRRPLCQGDPPAKETPCQKADSGIRSMNGRYASYWNAFLFKKKLNVDIFSIGAYRLLIKILPLFFQQCSKIGVKETVCEGIADKNIPGEYITSGSTL